MLLLIDVGNTRVKWSVPHNNTLTCKCHTRWRYTGSVACVNIIDLTDIWKLLPITQVIIANVAGSILQKELKKLLFTIFGMHVPITWFVSTLELAGLRNKYKNPTQLGCDRFASAIGAHAMFPKKALIIITCGTVTTIDDISAEGDFFGGMILPGLEIMLASLALNTAQLPQIQLTNLTTSPFPDNTTDAIIAGCISAQVGAIERAIVAHRTKYKDKEVLCILTGGAKARLSLYISTPNKIIDNLVLIGLYVVAFFNKESSPNNY